VSPIPSLGPGVEFDRIRAIARALRERAGPLDDDCALLPVGDATLALSTDLSLQGVHFRREWLEPREIGWRVAAAALSDLAAEGASVIGLLAAIGAPADAGEGELTALMEGVGDAVASVGGSVLGGDLSRAPGWTAALTVIGRAERPVRRAGACAGDGIWVTGALGGAGAALAGWLSGEMPSAEARRAFVHPEPRIEAGRWLAAHGARAMLDLSDGLGGDARHLAAASRVGLEIELDRVPVAGAALAAARRRGVAPPQFAAENGEDYELLVALPAEFGDREADRFRRECGVPLTRIGTATAGDGVRFLLAGRSLALAGFDHFR
jgi:thiamine-monophosphate kinase